MHGKISELCLFGKVCSWFRNVMKEEIVFIIPVRSYYPLKSHETLFEHNLISPRLIASYSITCWCRDSQLFSETSASIKRLKLLLWPCILFQAKAILSSDRNDAALPFFFSRLNFLLN